MTIKPVKTAPTPKYPDKYNEEIRRILTFARPRRWVVTPLVAGMLTASIALGLAGCDVAPGRPGGAEGSGSGSGSEGGRPVSNEFVTDGVPTQSPSTPPSPNTPDILEYVTLGEPMPFPTPYYNMLIPLFEYGEGTGAIGCVSIVAPVFMSEEEAFAIIASVFAENGMGFSRGGATLEGVNLPVTNIYEWNDEEGCLMTKPGSLKPDGSLEEEDLPVAFVSYKDVESWHEDTGFGMSISSYNVKKAARTLADNNTDLVVFYDPVAGNIEYDKIWEVHKEDDESEDDYYARFDALVEESRQAALAESEQTLRLQVEAFIAWLGAGG